MNGPLTGMRVIEGSAFVAAPLGGMTLAQLGADVIRFDQIGGGPDSRRWPLGPSGASLFWPGMNKGKRSLQVDLRHPEGQSLVRALITAPGKDSGMFLTNFPARGWMSYDRLRRLRHDLIMVSLEGNPDGSSEVDYTVHPATGYPCASGPPDLVEPVNSILPTWDLLLGATAATALLAAERARRRGQGGDFVRIALSDIALSVVGHLGRIAQAQVDSGDAKRDGNYLYGAFGRDFETADHRRVMVVALTSRQWDALKTVTGLTARFQSVAETFQVNLDTESGRYEAREAIADALTPWFAMRTLDDVRSSFLGSGVSWGPYQTFRQLINEDHRCSVRNPLFEEVAQAGVGVIRIPGSPIRFTAHGRHSPTPAPVLGENTEEILADCLGLGTIEIARLFDTGIVAGPLQGAMPSRS